MNNFDEILQYLLMEAEANPEMEVEKMVAKLAEKFELSAEEMAEMQESFLLLDEINAKAQELDTAREEGSTRDGWVKRELTRIAEESGNNGPIVIEEIEKGVQTALNDTLCQEEVI